ncbi:hypothetical protein TrVFT333_008055 [Trichoderma virens FT-333]|nr:hypothetical protein TrVFT333_008055 [Trichoderma virens FT-333]
MDETNLYCDSMQVTGVPDEALLDLPDEALLDFSDEALLDFSDKALWDFLDGTPFVQSQHPAPDHPVCNNSMHSSNQPPVDLDPSNLGVAPARECAASSQVPPFVNPHPTQASSPDDSLDIIGAPNMCTPVVRPPASDGAPRRLACIFSKCSPEGQPPTCLDKDFENFSRVKEHVRKKHCNPIYCPRCYLTRFRTRREFDAHLRQPIICHLREFKEMNGYNPENKEQNVIIGQRANPGKSEEERWMELFKAVFPGYLPPDSIYAA